MASGSTKSIRQKEVPKENNLKRNGQQDGKMYQNLVENSAVAIWSAPFDSFQFSYIGPTAEKIFGYPQQECMQPDFMEKILLPEEKEWVKEYIRLAIQEKHSYQLEYHIITKKGQLRALRDIVRLTYRDGKPYQKVGVTMDVSVYNQTLDELQASNRKFYSAFHNFPIPAFISRVKDGQVIDVNKNFLKISGFERNEIIGRSAFELGTWVNPQERDQVTDIIRKKGHLDKFPVLITDALGRVRNILLSAEIFDNNGEVSVLTMFYDVTEQIKTEERLQEINRELETFMYKSSHNLKGPVASIMGLLFLAEREVNDPKSVEYIGMMKKCAKGLESTLEELMDIARLKQGKLKVEGVNLAIMLDDISNKLKFMTEWQHVSYEVDIRQTHPFYTDPHMLYSILQNLIENAVKYRNEDIAPRIKVDATINSDMAEISVTDNGVGIPEEQQERVFEMFYRASDKASGTGLGLYIVKNSVEKLGGNIFIRSRKKEGSCFTISIPNLRPE